MTRVPLYPPAIDSSSVGNRIRSAAPVVGPGQWKPMGEIAAWLLGRGSTLVSAAGMPIGGVDPSFTGIDDGASAVFRYYTWPHEQNPSRVWYVTLSRGTAGTRCFGTFTTNSGATAEWSIPETAGAYEPRIFEVQETLASPSSTPGEVTLTVAHATASHDTAQVFVVDVSCHELPRVNLSDFGSVVVPDVESLSAGRLIYEDATASKSLHAVAKAAAAAESQARRALAVCHYNPTGLPITSGSFTSVVSGFVLARKMFAGDTVGELAWAAYVGSTGGAGELRVSASSGDTVTETVPSGGPAWITGTLDVRCDDMDNMPIDGGLEDGSLVDLMFAETRVTTGSPITLYGFCSGGAG